MKEIWLPVVEFPEHYEVSNLGRFRRSAPGSNATRVGRLLSLHRTRRGYLGVMFYVDGIRHRRRASRVVAAAFIGAIPPDCVVNHINGIVTDNRVENLEICTQSQNVRHAIDVLGVKRARGERQHLSKLTADGVLAIVCCAQRGDSHQSIAAKFGVTKQAVTAILNGKTWRHVTNRSPAAIKRPNKLSERQAKRVLRLRSNGWTQQAIADHFGVSKGAVNDLCNGRTWKHLTG